VVGVIAIVCADPGDAADYMALAATLPKASMEWIVVVRPGDMEGRRLSGAVYLGGSPELHQAVAASLALSQEQDAQAVDDGRGE
jgi:hypothetical protein